MYFTLHHNMYNKGVYVSKDDDQGKSPWGKYMKAHIYDSIRLSINS